MAGIFSYGLGLEDLDENRAEAPVEGDTVVEERVEEKEDQVTDAETTETDAEATDAPAEAPVEGAPTDGEAEEVKDAEDTAAEAEAEAEVLENEQLETELLEAQAEEQEIHEMDDAMEDAEGALDDHQELIESLEMIAQDGGMNRQAARFYQLSRKSIYGRLGIHVTTESFAMEAFDDVATRVVATVRSLEEEKSNFRKFLEGTKKFFLELFEKIKSFVLKILNTNNAVRKRTESLSKRLDKASFEGTLSEAQQKRLGKYFVVEGKTVSLSESAAYTVKECGKASTLPNGGFFINVLSDYFKEYVGKGDKPTPVSKTDVLKTFQEKLLEKVSLDATDKDEVLASFPGNYQLKVGGTETGTVGITFTQSEEVGDISIGKELMVTAEQANKALQAVIEILDGVDGINEYIKNSNPKGMTATLFEKLSDATKHSAADSSEVTASKNNINIAGAYITFARQYASGVVKWSSYLSTLARAYLEIVETSAFGKAKDQEAAGEPAKA